MTPQPTRLVSRLHRALLATAWLLLCATALPAAAAASEPEPERARIASMLAQQGLTGASWMRLTPGQGVVTGATGVRRAGGGEVQRSDRFQVGSIAKPVMAAGVLRLVTQGRLSLDAPLAQLLPQIALDNPWAATHPVRLRHLLDHTAGLEDAGLSLVMSTTVQADQPLAALFEGRGMRLAVRTRPGSEYSYSNFGYILVAMVIERVTGQRYEALLDAELLRPLGMHASTFAYTAAPGTDGAVVFGHVDGARVQNSQPMHLRPAGQFTTTAADMGAFARFLMSEGRIDGAIFIEPRLLRDMGRARDTEAARAGLQAGYALGLWRRDRHGVVGLCHEGSTFGFRAMLCLYPREAKAFFVAFNMDSESADYGAFDALLIEGLGLRALAAESDGESAVSDASAWRGWYARVPGKVPAFEYVDLVLNPVRLRTASAAVELQPLFGDAQSLAPVGGRLFRAPDRVRASHVLLEGSVVPEWSNGFSTYRRLDSARLYALWVSLALGLASLLLVLLVGSWRLLRKSRDFVRDPLMPTWLATLGSVLAFAAVGIGWQRLGEVTWASGALATMTAALPLAAVVGLWIIVAQRGGRKALRAFDTWLLLPLLQWCLVLVAWGMVPLRTWA